MQSLQLHAAAFPKYTPCRKPTMNKISASSIKSPQAAHNALLTWPLPTVSITDLCYLTLDCLSAAFYYYYLLLLLRFRTHRDFPLASHQSRERALLPGLCNTPQSMKIVFPHGFLPKLSLCFSSPPTPPLHPPPIISCVLPSVSIHLHLCLSTPLLLCSLPSCSLPLSSTPQRMKFPFSPGDDRLDGCDAVL